MSEHDMNFVVEVFPSEPYTFSPDPAWINSSGSHGGLMTMHSNMLIDAAFGDVAEGELRLACRLVSSAPGHSLPLFPVHLFYWNGSRRGRRPTG